LSDTDSSKIQSRLEYNDLIEEIIARKRTYWNHHILLSKSHQKNLENPLMLKAWGLSPESFIRDMCDFMYGGSIEFLNFVTLLQRGEL
jgi:hypothetical protein